MADGIDRRQCTRFSVEGAAVQYRKEGPIASLVNDYSGEAFPVLNVSKGGVCFQTSADLAENQAVSVLLSVPGEYSDVELRGRVRWSRTSRGAYPYEAGVQFSPFGSARGDNPMESLNRLRGLDEKHAGGAIR